MIGGAYNKRFDVALLIAGDADYVPIVDEIRRAGLHTLVAGVQENAQLACSDELQRAADWFVKLPDLANVAHFKKYFTPLEHNS
jgi:uncharacterized LabA/DUF88 family protein